MMPAIKEAVEATERAIGRLKEVLAAEQAKCPHARIIHSPWKSSEWGSAFKARRLCLDCGLEEEAMGSGWGDHDHSFRKLKSNGFHKVVDNWTLYGSRFPEAEVDVK